MTTAGNATRNDRDTDLTALETIAGAERRTSRHPSDADIRQAVADVWARAVQSVFLDGPAAHGFLQTADGRHIQCLVSPHGPLYSADAATPEQAQALFLSFARGDDAWRTAADWQVDGPAAAAHAGTHRERAALERREPWEREWTRARAEYRTATPEESAQLVRDGWLALESGRRIARYEWEVLRPAAGAEPAPGEAARLGAALEERYWHQALARMRREPIGSDVTARRMQQDVADASAFGALSAAAGEDLRAEIRAAQEHLARRRADACLRQAVRSRGAAPGRQTGRAAAAEFLAADWTAAFPGESVPDLEPVAAAPQDDAAGRWADDGAPARKAG